MSKKPARLQCARPVMEIPSKLFSGVGRNKTPPKDMKLQETKVTEKLTPSTAESYRRGLASCMAYG